MGVIKQMTISSEMNMHNRRNANGKKLVPKNRSSTTAIGSNVVNVQKHTCAILA